ncbi:hypothetical protein COLO4_36299 [Corchorus olitorius]|uniref:Uncharacterized protein n=1 Tax=Corchorus olitorius TaxID=93759 RepID=A0A1R3GA17_9ROSI|nr:hypothetical protein COLO4_36299 [Corchorus olitorius]
MVSPSGVSSLHDVTVSEDFDPATAVKNPHSIQTVRHGGCDMVPKNICLHLPTDSSLIDVPVSEFSSGDDPSHKCLFVHEPFPQLSTMHSVSVDHVCFADQQRLVDVEVVRDNDCCVIGDSVGRRMSSSLNSLPAQSGDVDYGGLCLVDVPVDVSPRLAFSDIEMGPFSIDDFAGGLDLIDVPLGVASTVAFSDMEMGSPPIEVVDHLQTEPPCAQARLGCKRKSASGALIGSKCTRRVSCGSVSVSQRFCHGVDAPSMENTSHVEFCPPLRLSPFCLSGPSGVGISYGLS